MASPGPSNAQDFAIPLSDFSDAHRGNAASFIFVSRGPNGRCLASFIHLIANESIFSVLSQVRRENDQHEAHRGGLVCVRKFIRGSFYSKVLSVVEIRSVALGAAQGPTRNRINEVYLADDMGQTLEDLGKYFGDFSKVPVWPSFQTKYAAVVSHGSTTTDKALLLTYSCRKGSIAMCMGVVLMAWLILGAVIMATKSITTGLMVAGVGFTATGVITPLVLWGFPRMEVRRLSTM